MCPRQSAMAWRSADMSRDVRSKHRDATCALRVADSPRTAVSTQHAMSAHGHAYLQAKSMRIVYVCIYMCMCKSAHT